MPRTDLLSNDHSRKRSNSPANVKRVRTVLLIIVLLIPTAPWDGLQAQSAPGTGVADRIREAGTESQRQEPVRSESVREPEPPQELSGFFVIGIVINAALILLFVAWAAKEWKKAGDKTRRAGE